MTGAAATAPVRDGAAMVAGMAPRLCPGRFAFVSVPPGEVTAEALGRARAMVREDEGVSLILPVAGDAPDAMAQITLGVHSALDGVGLTAAVAAALAAAGIPCNVVAARHHDHLFVPAALAEAALDTLRRLSDAARAPV